MHLYGNVSLVLHLGLELYQTYNMKQPRNDENSENFKTDMQWELAYNQEVATIVTTLSWYLQCLNLAWWLFTKGELANKLSTPSNGLWNVKT